MRLLRSGVLSSLLVLVSFVQAAEPPAARVLIVGTYHMANPGRDLHNVEVDDVLAPARQRQLDAVVSALARFEPNRVAVEWPAELTDERYSKYLAGTLPASRNEVVQLGFRLAQRRALKRVHGVDVEGDFPFEAVQQWAQAHGQTAAIERVMAAGAAEVARISKLHAQRSIGAVLRDLNQPAAIELNHSFYPALLRMGSGTEQPGAALLSAWYARNFAICARLLQAIEPGDRVVVLYGQGHAYLLRQCIAEAPGVDPVDPLEYLPR
jgi:hypothetical protein